MFFSVITKNLNRKTLTKNLVTIKRWDEVKDEKFKYYECSLKNPNFRERVTKNQYIGGIAFKRGGLGQFADLGADRLAKNRVVVFLRGPQCTLYTTHFLFSFFRNFTLSFQGFPYWGDRGEESPPLDSPHQIFIPPSKG